MKALTASEKRQILVALSDPDKVIADVAQDYGVPRRTLYELIKSTMATTKRAKAIKASRLKAKVSQINEELRLLQVG